MSVTAFDRNADGIFVAAPEPGTASPRVHDFQAAGRVLPSLDQILFGLIELVQLAVNLRDSQIHVRIIRHYIGKLLVHAQGLGRFFLSQQGLPQSALVTQLRRIKLKRLCGRLLPPLARSCACVYASPKIQEQRRRRMRGDSLQKSDRLGGLAFVHQQLRQLLDRRLVFRIALQDALENLFGLVVFVL